MKLWRLCTAGCSGRSGRRGGDEGRRGLGGRAVPGWSRGSTPWRAPSVTSTEAWWAGIPVPGSCWLPLLLETHGHSHTRHRHKHRCTVGVQKHSAIVMENCTQLVRECVNSFSSSRSGLLLSLTLWPWSRWRSRDSTRGGNVDAFQQTIEQPSAFDAASPSRSMLIHPHGRGGDYSEMTRKTLFVISGGGNTLGLVFSG